MDSTSASSQSVTDDARGAVEPGGPDELPRRPTARDWAFLNETFPNLYEIDVWITGEATLTYNCIAWSWGITDRWIPPDSPLAAFQVQYQNVGFTVVGYGNGTVDGWGKPKSGPDKGGTMLHASRLSPDPRFSGLGLWESKLGPNFRITHGRDQLTGTKYGDIVTSFRPTSQSGIRLPDMEPELTAEERQRLRRMAEDQTSDIALGREFARRREAFLAAAAGSMQSRTEAFTELAEFADLTALGEVIVPLVIAQLDDPEGFLLLGVLDALAPSVTAVDYDPLTGLQSRARLIARAWLADH